MIKKRSIAILQERSFHMPDGYVEDILSHANESDEIAGWYTIEDEKLVLIRRKWEDIKAGNSEIPKQKRPKAKLSTAASLARAILTGEKVDEATQKARSQICAACDKVREDDKGPWCGICGCKVAQGDSRLTNLTAYKENLPHWGCKHPERDQGKGWPLTQQIVA